MFCDQCGAAIDPGAKFCEECGTSLGSAGIKPVLRLALGLKSRIWLWLLVGGGAVLLIVSGMFFAFRGKVLEEKGSLSRKEATRKIQAYSETAAIGVVPLSWDDGRTLNALQEEGYLQWKSIERGNVYYPAVTPLEKGKQLFEKTTFPGG